MNKERKQAASAEPLWFRILVPLFGGVIILGILYALFASRGVFSRQTASADAEKYIFHTDFLVLPEDGGDEAEIAVHISYDSVSQKLTVTPSPEEEDENTVRLTAENFERLLDSAGGVPWQNADGTELRLTGAEAYACARGENPDGSEGDAEENQAKLVAAFLSDMRTHSNDAVFMLKLMKEASSCLDSNLGIKTLASFGKNLLKADSLTIEVEE